jgi:hypothetical protein
MVKWREGLIEASYPRRQGQQHCLSKDRSAYLDLAAPNAPLVSSPESVSGLSSQEQPAGGGEAFLDPYSGEELRRYRQSCLQQQHHELSPQSHRKRSGTWP